MRRLNSRRSKQSGVGFFLVVILIMLLMPLVLMMLKGSIYQNKNALRDRNIKTSREMAESIGVDYMNSFATDWHRDSFDILYKYHDTKSIAGLGSASSTLDVARSSGTIRVATVATYDKGGAISPGARATKGVDALFTFSSDFLKFDFVWPQSVVMGVTTAWDIKRFIDNSTTTVFIDGNFDTDPGYSPLTLSGFWVVKGEFRLRNSISVQNALVHCLSRNYALASIGLNAEVRAFPDDQFVPRIEEVHPQGPDVNPSLDYYGVRASTGFLNPGGGFLLRLGPGDEYHIKKVNADFSDYGIPALWEDYSYFPGFVPPFASTAPFILAIRSGTVQLRKCEISRPITVAVLGLEETQITDSIRYDGVTSADENHSFALLSLGDLTFHLTSNATTELHGFYGTTNGHVKIYQVNVLENPSLKINGTLYGMIWVYTLKSGANNCVVRADRNLSLYPPPLFPRRPRLIMWDYVP